MGIFSEMFTVLLREYIRIEKEFKKKTDIFSKSNDHVNCSIFPVKEKIRKIFYFSCNTPDIYI